jgi:ABC-type arginine/histidine transport system permease subunit
MTKVYGLTHKQKQALPIIATIGNREEAARRAGISKNCLYKWLKDPFFKQELEKLQNEIFIDSFGFLKAAAIKAAATLINLMARIEYPSIQRAAANDVLNQVVKFKEVMEIESRLTSIEAQIESEGKDA